MGAADPRIVERVDDRLRAELLDCWVEATNAGGAVGFVAPVNPAEVEPVVDRHVADVHSGSRLLLTIRTDGGSLGGSVLAGFGFLLWNDGGLAAHWATVRALMVHPKWQGSGFGRMLLDELAGIARGRGLEFLSLAYRSGLGLGAFYAKAGYVETGRMPGGLRVAPGDDRDIVEMILRL